MKKLLKIIVPLFIIFESCKAQEIYQVNDDKIESLMIRLDKFDLFKLEDSSPCFAKIMILSNPSGVVNREGEITNDILIYVGDYGEYPTGTLHEIKDIYAPRDYSFFYDKKLSTVNFEITHGTISSPLHIQKSISCK